MSRKFLHLLVSTPMVLSLIVSACAPTPTAAPATSAPVATEAPAITSGLSGDSAAVAQQFFSQADLDRDIKLIDAKPMGPEGKPWEQYLIDNSIETTQYKKDGPYTICFSNAGVNNPWRVVGYTTMQQEVALHDEIAEFIHVDAGGKDEKQIADIADLVAGGKCDVLIVSPNTTAALTPAVEKACESLPVIVFDRGVQTDCPVVFTRPIGGYAFGYTGAKFIVDNLPNGPASTCLSTAGRRPSRSSSRTRSSRSSASNSATATTPRSRASSTTISTASARSTRFGWTPARQRSRRSKPSRMPGSRSRSWSAKISRTT